MELCKKRNFQINGKNFNTPLLVPSFSSKVPISLDKTVDAMKEYITDVTLISAYDIFYDKVSVTNLDFPELLIIDSGGFECLTKGYLEDQEFSDYTPQKWDEEKYKVALEKIKAAFNESSNACIAIVNFDHPEIKSPLISQIESATKLFKAYPQFGKFFLLKPEPDDHGYINFKKVDMIAEKLINFDVIGITEKELGNSFSEKMKNLNYLRRILDKHTPNKPIHVFGSLDVLSTPLLYFSGGDIFDGLTWLRMAYHEGLTVYQSSAIPMKDIDLKEPQCRTKTWIDNYYILTKLKNDLSRCTSPEKVSTYFKKFEDFYLTTLNILKE